MREFEDRMADLAEAFADARYDGYASHARFSRYTIGRRVFFVEVKEDLEASSAAGIEPVAAETLDGVNIADLTRAIADGVAEGIVMAGAAVKAVKDAEEYEILVDIANAADTYQRAKGYVAGDFKQLYRALERWRLYKIGQLK